MRGSDAAQQQHRCQILAGAHGLISPGWCITQFADVVRGFSPTVSEADVASPELLLHDDTIRGRRLQIYYTPFDRVNAQARVLLVGITPGVQQLALAVRTAAQALQAGRSPDDAVRLAKAAASFAGPMRNNAVAMLDDIGVAKALGIASTTSLFEPDSDLASSTSAICHAVFVDGKNYTGHGLKIESTRALRAFAEQVLAAELEATPDALVIPFGGAASAAVELAAAAASLPTDRFLFGFPHPSGANGHRKRQFAQERGRLHASVEKWATRL